MTDSNGEYSALPKGWELVKHTDIAQINPKLPDTNLDENLTVSFLPMASVKETSGKYDLSQTRFYGDVKKGYTAFIDGDLIFAKITPCMENGKIAIVENLKNGIGFGSTEFHVSRIRSPLNKRYFFYYFTQTSFKREARRNMTGSAGQLRVPKKYFESVEIPIPPLPEQYRIVDKIEELFSELDNGVASLKKALEQLKTYRQAVLKWAFEGKLTEAWRSEHADTLEDADTLLQQIKAERERHQQQKLDDWKQAVKDWEDNGKEGKKPTKPKKLKELPPLTEEELKGLPKLPDGWVWVKIGHSYLVFVGSTPSRKNKKYWDGKINWVSSGEVSFCKIYSTKERITQLGLENSSTQIHPIGTVMLGMIGEGKTRGQSAILMTPAAHNQNTAAIQVGKNDCSSKLLYYFFYFQYEKTRTIGSGNNQKALNKTRVENLKYPLFSLQEQNQIVQEIESRLSICDQLEATITENLEKAEALRQSILKRAFEGKLVPQNPDDEPASELLKRIQQDTPSPPKKTKRKRKTKAQQMELDITPNT